MVSDPRSKVLKGENSGAEEVAVAILRLAISSVHRSLSGALGEIVSEWPSAVSPDMGESLARREFERSLVGTVDRVADELQLIYSSGSGLPHEEYSAALRGLARMLDGLALTLVATRDIADRSPSDLHKRFLPKLEEEWADLRVTQEAQAYGASALTLCCYALVVWTRVLPTSRSSAAWANFALSSRLIEQSRTMLLEVRRAGVTGAGRGVHRLAGTQRRDISSALRQMELFGLPVERRFRRVPIDVSYLTSRLAVEAQLPRVGFASESNSRASERPRPTSEVARSPKGIPIETLLAELSRDSSEGHGHERGMRLVLTGSAGSGKTTAVQWIAFTAAQQGLKEVEQADRPLLPLFVKLRDLFTGQRSPSDRALLYSTVLRQEVDDDWLLECSGIVTPLVLLDGWDEIPPDRKAVAQSWVGTLVERFPLAHVIVTSRPEGIPQKPFDDLGFRWVSVLPLSQDESIELARRWFKGLRDQLYSSPDLRLSDVDLGERDLLRELTSPAIGDMADSPLLTSMLCCLYATGRGAEPNKRGELYELVLQALLDLRERQRGGMPRLWRSMDIDKKLKLVGSIARAMSETNARSLPITKRQSNTGPSIVEIVADLLPVLGRQRKEAVRWTELLLSRSVILQRVSRNDAEFVHGSVRDFLAAQTFRDEGDLDEVLDRAGSGELALLPFACFKGSQGVVDTVILWILERLRFPSTSGRYSERELLFVLVECLGAATLVSSAVRARAEQSVSAILPPREVDEPKIVASLGNAALPYLTRDRTSGRQSRRLTIDALSRIGTAEAMDELAVFASHADATDAESLAMAMGRFDPESYSRHVLAQVKCDLKIVTRDEALLRAAPQLGAISTLHLSGIRFSDFGLSRARHLHRLKHLVIEECTNLGELDWTAAVDGLKSLTISRSRGLVRVDKLGPKTLWGLNLNEVQLNGASLGAILSRLPDLRFLSIQLPHVGSRVASTPVVIEASEALAGTTCLTTLSLYEGVKLDSLDFLANLPKLTNVTIGYGLNDVETQSLLQCRGLRKLTIKAVGDAIVLNGLSELQKLQKVTIFGAGPMTLRALDRLPKLTHLTLVQSNLGFIGRFAAPRSVRNLELIRCNFRSDYAGVKKVPKDRLSSTLSELTWSGGSTSSLSFLRGMPGLLRLSVEDNGSVTSFDGLESLPDGCNVRITGTKWGIDDSPVNALRRRCHVLYEPNYDSHAFTTGFWVDYGGS